MIWEYNVFVHVQKMIKTTCFNIILVTLCSKFNEKGENII